MKINLTTIVSNAPLIISILSFLMSIFTLFRTEKVRNQQIEINKRELEKIKQEKQKENSIILNAKILHLGDNKHKLKVSNIGGKTAYNVVASINKDSNIIMLNNEIQPYEELLKNDNYEISIVYYDSSASKCTVTLTWEDENRESFSKNILCS